NTAWCTCCGAGSKKKPSRCRGGAKTQRNPLTSKGRRGALRRPFQTPLKRGRPGTMITIFLSLMADEEQSARRARGCVVALGRLIAAAATLMSAAVWWPSPSRSVPPATAVGVWGSLWRGGAGVGGASGFWTRRWGGFFLHLLVGLLYLFVGLVIIERPALGAA